MARLIQRLRKVHREGRLLESLLLHLCTLPAVYLSRKSCFGLGGRLAQWANQGRALEAESYLYKSVKDWKDTRSGYHQEIYPSRVIQLGPVRSLGGSQDPLNLHQRSHQITLPAAVLYNLGEMDVIGGSEMVFADEKTVLYDELALGDVNRYGSKVFSIVPHNYRPPYLPAATRKSLLCLFLKRDEPQVVPCAISLLKDHSRNYYHWLLESVPRAILASRCLDWDDAPLLVDEGLPRQFIESLRLIAPTRKLVEIPHGVRVRVEKLHFPSVLSSTHDYYGAVPAADDFVIAPEATALLREQFLKHATITSRVRDRKCIYVARTGGKHRVLNNESELIALLERLGFSIMYPGELSFTEQVALFANAKIIVGPTGAGMANIVFANLDCKIVILAAATRNANYYLFAQLSQYVGIDLVYIEGQPSDATDLHSDYQIEPTALEHLMERFITEIDTSKSNMSTNPARS